MLQFIYKAKKGADRLTAYIASNRKIVDEIIDNAAALSLESQKCVLMMAKAMLYVRNSAMRKSNGEQPREYAK